MSLKTQMPKRAVAGLLALCCAGAMVFAAAPAGAAKVHLYSFSFGLFSNAQDVTVEQSTGDVYVLDTGAEAIEKFNAAGEPVDFAALGSNVLDGASGADLTPQGSFVFGSPSGSQLAIDESGGATQGDIYVTDTGHSAVDVFAASGTFLGAIDPTSATPDVGGEPCGVAVGSTGDVYVTYFSEFEGHVDKYAPSGATPEQDTFEKQLQNAEEYCYTTLDASEDVYLQKRTPAGTGELYRYEPSQFGLEQPEEAKHIANGVSAETADPTAGGVLVDEQSQIATLDASGKPLGAPYGSGTLSESQGIAIDDQADEVYAANGSSVNIYTPPPLLAPSVGEQWVGKVTGYAADLHAEIDPRYRATEYHFQYIAKAEYEANLAAGQDGFTGAARVPGTGAGKLEEEVEADLPVNLHVQGLQPATTYEYRALATNAAGPVTATPRAFTTPAAAVAFALPDDRAYQLVSPPAKNGASIEGLGRGPFQFGVFQAAADGSSVAYVSANSFGAEAQGAPDGSQYLSERSGGVWRTQNITTPTNNEGYDRAGRGTPYRGFSEDLGSALILSGQPEGGRELNPPLAAGAPQGYQNFYLRDDQDGALTPLLTSAPSSAPNEALLELRGATPDLAHVVISSEAALTPGAVAGGENLYEWANGTLQAINILPGVSTGQTAPGAALGEGHYELHTLSDDGSRAFWSVGGELYVREGIGKPQSPLDGEGRCTVPSDACTLRLPQGAFIDASSNGAKVLIGTPSGTGEVFDLETGHELSDITAGRGGFEPLAGMSVLGASDDLSYIYFTDSDVLPGAGSNQFGHGPVEGERNLYLYHEGAGLSFIGTLSLQDKIGPELSGNATRVTPDGRTVIFTSTADPSGYDNHDLKTGALDNEVYRYSAETNSLACLSCNASGARPSGPSSIPVGTSYINGQALHQSRALSAGGERVFFDSSDDLVPQDTNGQEDVYEWEAPGAGSCAVGSGGGCLYLISSGTSAEGASFIDASESGGDVFFVTNQELVTEDIDEFSDLYDASVGGGAGQVGSPECSGTGCQGLPAAQPIFATPPSVTANGAGNFSPAALPAVESKKKPTKCAKGKKFTHGKCAKPRVKSKHKAKAKKAKRVDNNRRASR